MACTLRDKRRFPRYRRPVPPALAPVDVEQVVTARGLFRARDGNMG
jgi:hypothetical protein